MKKKNSEIIGTIGGRVTGFRLWNIPNRIKKMALKRHLKILLFEVDKRIITETVFFKFEGTNFDIKNFEFEYEHDNY